MAEVKKSAIKDDFKIELIVIFVLLFAMGLPGNFTIIFGAMLDPLMKYGTFFLEIFVMLASSGNNWLNVQIINLDKRYMMIYVFIAVVFIESMAVTRYPTMELLSCMRLCTTIFFVIWMQEHFEFMHMVELIGVAQVIFLLLNIVFTIRYPAYAHRSGESFTNALTGLYTDKNGLASEASFGILVFAFIIKEKRKKMERYLGWMAALGIQSILLLMCQATGPVFCTLLALIPLFLPKHIRLPLGVGYIACNIIFLFGTLTLMPYFEWFFDAIGKDASLTGRMPLWNRVIEVMMNHRTFTGYGYAMFWRDSKGYGLLRQGFDKWSSLSQVSTGSHNVLLELWLNIGLIGIAFLFLMILYATRNIEELSEKRYYFCSTILMHFMINGFTERCLGGTYDYKTLGMFLVFAVCCNRSDSDRAMIKKKQMISEYKRE